MGSSMYTLIAFASQWGSKFGGINTFNTDFLEHFSAAYNLQAKTICIVSKAEPEEIEAAKALSIEEKGITLDIDKKTKLIKLLLDYCNECGQPPKREWVGY